MEKDGGYEAMKLFRSMGHSSMSIPREWNDRKFMEGEGTKRETVYEFTTAARGLVTIYIAI